MKQPYGVFGHDNIAHPSDTTRTFLNIIDNLNLEEQDPEAVDPSKLGHEKQFEDFDNVTPEAYDENLKKLIKLNNNGEEVLGKVVSRKRNSDGKLIGKHNIDPKLDSRIYWLEMQDGGMAEVTTNFIADNIFAQCDDEDNIYRVFDEIIDCQRKRDC